MNALLSRLTAVNRSSRSQKLIDWSRVLLHQNDGKRLTRDEIAFFVAIMADMSDIDAPMTIQGWSLLITDLEETYTLTRMNLL